MKNIAPIAFVSLFCAVGATLTVYVDAHTPASAGKNYLLSDKTYRSVSGGEKLTSLDFLSCGQLVPSRTYLCSEQNGRRETRTVCFGLSTWSVPGFK